MGLPPRQTKTDLEIERQDQERSIASRQDSSLDHFLRMAVQDPPLPSRPVIRSASTSPVYC